MRVVVQHRSRYVYPRPALLGPQTIRLRPADHTRTRVESYALTVSPEHRLHWQRDPHGNHVARVTFKAGQPVTELALDVALALDVQPINPFDFLVDDRAKQVPFTYPDANEVASFLDLSDPFATTEHWHKLDVSSAAPLDVVPAVLRDRMRQLEVSSHY